jgi:hypothetical protein
LAQDWWVVSWEHAPIGSAWRKQAALPVCLLKRVMDPVRMIIGDVIADQTTQMSIIEDYEKK